MKKIISIIMALVLLLSIVPGTMAKMRVDVQMTPVEEQDTNAEENQDAEQTTVRAINAEKLREFAKEFKQAKQAYMEARKVSKESRQAFLDAKSQLRACKDSENEQCAVLSNQVNQYAKDFVINGIQMAIDHLTQLESKIEASESLDEGKVAEMTSDIDAAIARLNEIIEKVKAAQTKQEIKDATKEVKQVWAKIKQRERVYAVKLVHAKVWNILHRAEKLEEKLERVLARMEAKGLQVDDLQTKLDQFNAKVSEAKTLYTEAEGLIKQAFDSRTEDVKRNEVMTQVQEARQLLRQAHEAIKEAHSILIGIVQGMNAKGGDLSEETSEQENEEETPEQETEESSVTTVTGSEGESVTI